MAEVAEHIRVVDPEEDRRQSAGAGPAVPCCFGESLHSLKWI